MGLSAERVTQDTKGGVTVLYVTLGCYLGYQGWCYIPSSYFGLLPRIPRVVLHSQMLLWTISQDTKGGVTFLDVTLDYQLGYQGQCYSPRCYFGLLPRIPRVVLHSQMLFWTVTQDTRGSMTVLDVTLDLPRIPRVVLVLYVTLGCYLGYQGWCYSPRCYFGLFPRIPRVVLVLDVTLDCYLGYQGWCYSPIMYYVGLLPMIPMGGITVLDITLYRYLGYQGGVTVIHTCYCLPQHFLLIRYGILNSSDHFHVFPNKMSLSMMICSAGEL